MNLAKVQRLIAFLVFLPPSLASQTNFYFVIRATDPANPLQPSRNMIFAKTLHNQNSF